jgi:hypothetical protein
MLLVGSRNYALDVPLEDAIRSGNLQEVQRLVYLGAIVRYAHLGYAYENGYPEIAEFLQQFLTEGFGFGEDGDF